MQITAGLSQHEVAPQFYRKLVAAILSGTLCGGSVLLAIAAPVSTTRDSGGSRHFFNLLLKNGTFWSILMSKCASQVYTCILSLSSV